MLMFFRQKVDTLPTILEKTALSCPKATIFGNRLEWILKDEEPREEFLSMIGLVLELVEFTDENCP
jgi:hypothetical protein